MFMRDPFARALAAAGATNVEDIFTYQDYLYELLANGSSEKPVTEQQWEMICDIQGKRRLYYASNSRMALENVERKTEKSDLLFYTNIGLPCDTVDVQMIGKVRWTRWNLVFLFEIY